jgi:hypothetical protein
MTSYNSLGYLAQVVFNEPGPIHTSDLGNLGAYVEEQAYVATALMNRFNIANWGITAYTASGTVVNPNQFAGGLGATLSNIILQAAGNGQTWGIYTDGKLNPTPLNTLQSALNTDVSVGIQVALPNATMGLTGSGVPVRMKVSLQAGVTQLVECDLAKVDVAGSNPVSRSSHPFQLPLIG